MKLRQIAAIAASMGAMATAIVMSAGPASAAPGVTIGGGAGIVIPQSARTGSVCTLNSIGHDATGALVGLTAGHCGNAGQQVYSEVARKAGPLGTIETVVRPKKEQSTGVLDYAVIRFDASKVTPTSAYRGTRIIGAGGPVAPGQIACKRGRTSGQDCGVSFGRGDSPNTSLVQTCSKPGDSGAPVVVNNRVTGILRGNIGYTNLYGTGIPFDVKCTTPANPVHNPTEVVNLSSVTADLHHRHLPGAGYRPI